MPRLTRRNPVGRIFLLAGLLLLAGKPMPHLGQEAAREKPRLYARDNLVAWCIVPFDAKRRGPAERAEMVKRLGLTRVAYDWRDEHVATFEQEIVEYRKRGLDYFAFWGVHDKAFELFQKYDLHPQIWVMPPNATAPTQQEQVAKAAQGLLPVVERTRQAKLPLGLYNHGGWGGEPENMVAICEYLRKHHAADHVGIVYNLHHGHDHVTRFERALAAMKPYLLCLNINGMAPEGDKRGQKILQLGAGELDVRLLRLIRDSGYQGPIGIIGHTQDDVELRLRDNLDGLDWIIPQLDGAPAGPRPSYRTPVPAPAAVPAAPTTSSTPGRLKLVPGKFGQALDAQAAGAQFRTVGPHRLAPLTVECWTRLSSKAGFNILVASEPKSSATHWEMYSYAGSGVFSVYMPGRGGEYRSMVDIADQRWHHVSMVLERARLRLFVDGQMVLDKAVPPPPASDAGASDGKQAAGQKPDETTMGLGRLVEGGIGCDGLLDEVHFRRGPHPPTGPPTAAPRLTDDTLGLWRFEQLADGSKLLDETTGKIPAVAAQGQAAPGDAASPARQAAVRPKVPAHWGKAAVGFEGWEDDWVDRRWQEAEVGDWLGTIMALPQGPYRKTLQIRVGSDRQGTVCFDTQHLSLRAAWRGFVEFNPTRFGIISPPKPAGEVLFTMPERAGWNAERVQYLGQHVHERRVVLRYEVDGVTVLDSPWCETVDGQLVFIRSLQIGSATRSLDRPLECTLLDLPATAGGSPVVELAEGEAGRIEERMSEGRRRVVLKVPAGRAGERLVLLYSASRLPADHAVRQSAVVRMPLEPLTLPGSPRWTEKIETEGRMAADDAPYVVDTYGVPFDNPYKALMFTSGHDFLSNGDIVVSTVHGDVWRVSHLDAERGSEPSRTGSEPSRTRAEGAARSFRTRWQRVATGLHQPLGLVVARRAMGDEIFVLCRDQITRLHDRNGDGETDYYECFSNVYPTSAGGHDYITCLEMDREGGFYFVHANLGVVRVAPDGKSYSVLSTGLRNPNGMGLGPGDVVTAAPQEGEWTPASAIYVARPGAHFGGGGPRVTPERPLGFDPPLIWIPRRVDNSSGGQTWVTSERWGPLSGHLLHLSFGQCSLMVVGTNANSLAPLGVGENNFVAPAAACLTEFPFRFDSGAMRGRFSPRDGQLYVTGLRGWTSAASVDGCLQRVRYTGREAHLPLAVKPYANGVALTFSEPLDQATAEQPGNYHLEQWNYRYSQSYGSPEYRVSDGRQEGRDEVRVRSATLLDPRTVFLEVKELRPVHVLAIACSLRDRRGESFRRTTYATIHRVSAEKVEESRLVRRASPEGLDDESAAGLRPGLLARIANLSSSPAERHDDARVDRMAALFVKSGETISPFLPAGPFSVRWEGFLRVPLPQTCQFRLEGSGAARLTVGDTLVLEATQLEATATTTSRPVSLQGGYNKVVVEYQSPATGDSRFRWMWESDDFALEPVPPALLACHGDDPQLIAREQLRRGRELFVSLRCHACHASRLVPAADLIGDAPRLATAGRLNANWVARWLRDPHRWRAESRMPRLNVTEVEATDIAAWLAAQPAALNPSAKGGAELGGAELASEGSTLFEDLACLACHTRAATDSSEFPRISLSRIKEKYEPHALLEFLREPRRFHPATRMPDFQLSEREAAALASHLLSLEAPGAATVAATEPGVGNVERGGKLFVERGCADCHAVGENVIRPRGDDIAMVDVASSRGCLSLEPHERSGVPWYSLTPADRAALTRLLGTESRESTLQSVERTAPLEAARSLQQSLRCNACHDQDAARSPRGRILVEEGERGVIPESLPNLTWTGEKLYAEWSREFVGGKRPDAPLRPWLKARMPAFPEHAATLTQGMAAQHGVAVESAGEMATDPERVALGLELIQRSALDCRQCHAVGQLPAQGDDQTKIAPGINFAIVRQRVRHDYYQRFTLDPPRFDLTTKMPKLAPDGKRTKVTSILSGDARKQFDAIWQFIQQGARGE